MFILKTIMCWQIYDIDADPDMYLWFHYWFRHSFLCDCIDSIHCLCYEWRFRSVVHVLWCSLLSGMLLRLASVHWLPMFHNMYSESVLLLTICTSSLSVQFIKHVIDPEAKSLYIYLLGDSSKILGSEGVT